MEQHHNPDDERRRARREQELAKQIRAHGGTGFAPDLDPIEACHRGVCMKCSGTWGALHTHVWKHYPRLSMREGIAAFRREFKIPADVPIDADGHRETLRAAALARMHGADGAQIRDNLRERSRGPHPERYGKTGLNPSGWNPSNWEIAKRVTSGMEQLEVAKELGGGDNHKLVGRRAKAMDLVFNTTCLCDHGEPFTNGMLFRLREASGFESVDFDKRVGLSEGRSQATRPTDSMASAGDARKVIKWRDSVVRQLLSVAASGTRALRLGSKSYRQDEVLRTLLPELSGLNDALVLTVRDIQVEAQRNSAAWSMTKLGEFVSTEAVIEHSCGGADRRWRTTLRYLYQAEEFLEKNLDRLRSSGEDGAVGSFVREMIGSRYGATHWTIQNALRDRAETIESSEMMGLISAHTEVPAASGRPRGRQADETPNQIVLAAALTFLRRSQPEMIPFLYPGQHDKEAGRKAVQKFLTRNAAAIRKETANMTAERAKEMLRKD